MRAFVGTIYNPAHLFRALRERGYDVRTEYPKTGTPKFEISKRVSSDITGNKRSRFFPSADPAPVHAGSEDH